ncbi:MAG: hypothetical protein ACJ77E_03395 [Gaiellaceae bacterium]
MRFRLAATLALMLAFAAAATASAGGRVSQIYFYTDTFNPIGTPYATNVLTVQPRLVPMAADGHWVISNVTWRGWGKSTAHGAGISDASDCKPSCAAGTRKRTSARIVLSHPVRLLGHTVYGCFELTIPAVPAANEHLCIKRATSGAGYLYEPAGAGTPPAQPAAGADARFYTPSRNISCEISDDGSAQAAVGCLMTNPQASVNLHADGHAVICQHQANGHCTGNFGEGPPFRQLPYGRSVSVGRFLCSSASTGITCVVRATRKGFFMSVQSVRPMG